MRPTFTVWSMSTHGDNASPNRKSYSFFVVVCSRQMTGTANACTNGRCGTRHHLTHNLCFFSCNKSQLSGLRSYAIRVLCSFVFQVERKDSLSLRIKQPKRDRFFSSLISHLEHWTKKKRKVFPRSDIVIFGVILDFYRVTYTNSNTKTNGIKMQFIFRSRHKLLWTCHCFQIDGVNTIFVDIFPSLHATQMVKVLEMRRIVTTYRRFMHIVRYLYSIENCISDSCLRQFLLLPLAALPRQIW